MTASRRLNSSTFSVTRSSVQSLIRMSRLRSKSRPRCLNGTPTASNSRAYQPAATPRTRRPLEITSRLPSAFAATTGLRSGSTSTPVPSLMRRGARGDGAERGDRVEDRERRLHAEQDVVPRPERLEAERLGALRVGVERVDVRDLARADEVADREADEVRHPMNCRSGIEHAQDVELLVRLAARWSSSVVAHQHLEAGVGLHLLDGDAGMQRNRAACAGSPARSRRRRAW